MKLLYKVGIIGLVVGIFLFLGGFALAKFDIENLDRRGPNVEKTYKEIKTFDEIKINLENSNVIIKKSETLEFEFKYYENKKESITIEDSNNILSIDSKNNETWLDFINLFHRKHEVTLAIPNSFSGNINLITKNGNIEIENINANDFIAISKNGNIEIKNTLVSEKVKVESYNGEIEVSGVTAKEVEARTKNGNIRLIEIIAAKIEGKTANGNIKIKKLSATESMDFNTANGNISGSIKGNYFDHSFFTKTRNGKNNLPEKETNGAITLKCETSNGNISIEFVE